MSSSQQAVNLSSPLRFRESKSAANAEVVACLQGRCVYVCLCDKSVVGGEDTLRGAAKKTAAAVWVRAVSRAFSRFYLMISEFFPGLLLWFVP